MENPDIKKIYHSIKQVEPKFNLFNIIKSLYYFLLLLRWLNYMDLIDDYIRKNMGFEVERIVLIKKTNVR